MDTRSISGYRLETHGGPEVLELKELSLPVPGPGQIRVRMGAMALNHLDLWVRRGIPGVKFPLPMTPGSDGAGTIDALGAGVRGLDPGTEVFVLPGVSCGCCRACLAGEDNLCPDYGILGESTDGTAAEAIVIPAANVAPVPVGMSLAEAASFPLTFMTAWQMLVNKARIRAGDRVLIHAAASGVSTAGIQIAREHGALVATTAGSDEKLALGLELGADLALSYKNENWVREIRRWAGPGGVDIVFDHVGEDTFQPSLRTLGKGGRYVFCGASSGFTLKTDFRPVFFKNQEILGSTMGRKADLHRIAQLFSEGRFRPVIAESFSFDELSLAHGLLESRGAAGKVVVRIG